MSPTGGENPQPSAKRAQKDNEVDSTGTSRSKRQKYTPQACNECKKRKIKCSGGLVCRRCETNNIPCQYSVEPGIDSGQAVRSAFNNMQSEIDALRGTVQQLSNDVKALQAESHASKQASTGQERTTAVIRVSQPPVPGPTSSAFNLEAANSSLRQLGVDAEDDEGHESMLDSREASPSSDCQLRADQDPLLGFSPSEMLRLVQFYQQESGSVYPCIDIGRFEEKLQSMNSNPEEYVENMKRAFNSEDLRLIRAMIATALVIEGEGECPVSKSLMEMVESPSNYSLRGMNIKYNELQTMYHFHVDEEIVAWRAIGLASRIALELGLHRRHGLFLQFPNPEDHEFPVKLFWCIYVLDKRMSLGVGLPYALHEADIDTKLPTPGDAAPYLECMISYGRLLSKIWLSMVDPTTCYENGDHRRETQLEQQIQEWEVSLPEELKLRKPIPSLIEPSKASIYRIQVLLRIRANQMRIFVNRHHLTSTEAIFKSLSTATRIVFIAQDTIQTLASLNEASNIYRKQQNAFNYYLVSALSAILLAVCHAPAEFSGLCRPEFFAAMDIIKGFSKKSRIAQRLWKRVKKFRYLAGRRFQEPVDLSSVRRVGRSGRIIWSPPPRNETSRPVSTTQTPPSENSGWVNDLALFDDHYGVSPDEMAFNQTSNDLMNFFETLEDDQTTTQQGETLPNWLSETGNASRIFGDLI